MVNDGSRGGGILVLGAGELGMAVLRGLAERRGAAIDPGLTVLLRPGNHGGGNTARGRLRDVLRSLRVRFVQADIGAASGEELAGVLADFSTVICCTGFVGGPGTRRRITAAVLSAGVDRYVPWQFGVDYDAVGRGSGQDVWDEQLDVREVLRAQSRTRWTIVSTGMFTSFLFEPSFGVVDLAGNRVHALGRWDNKVTVTTSEDIGRLTAAILAAEPPIEGTAFVAGDTVSYAQLADIVELVSGQVVERELWTVAALEADLASHPEDDIRKYRLAFARETGVWWRKESTFNARHGLAVTDIATWLEGRRSRPPT